MILYTKKGFIQLLLLLLCGTTLSFTNVRNGELALKNTISGSDTLLKPTQKIITVIQAKEIKKLIKKAKRNKIYLVDVRTPEEFESKHLKYAQNINYRSIDLVNKLKTLDQHKPIYLYCRSGNRSGSTTDTLKALGYTLVYNIGALDSLTKIGLPLNK